MTFSECMPCVILRTRILFPCTLCTQTHTDKHTQTHGRCQLCCLLSPGLVHTRIPPAGSTHRTSLNPQHGVSFVLSLALSPASPNPIPTHSRRFTRAPCHSSGGNRQQLLGIIAQQQRRGERQREGEGESRLRECAEQQLRHFICAFAAAVAVAVARSVADAEAC